MGLMGYHHFPCEYAMKGPIPEVIIYGVGFQFAWGTIPWIYPAELFSMQEKETAVSLAVGVNYVPLTANKNSEV